jgi:hypothetical protein
MMSSFTIILPLDTMWRTHFCKRPCGVGWQLAADIFLHALMVLSFITYLPLSRWFSVLWHFPFSFCPFSLASVFTVPLLMSSFLWFYCVIYISCTSLFPCDILVAASCSSTRLVCRLSLKVSHHPHHPPYNDTPTCSWCSLSWPRKMGPIGWPKISVTSC